MADPFSLPESQTSLFDLKHCSSERGGVSWHWPRNAAFTPSSLVPGALVCRGEERLDWLSRRHPAVPRPGIWFGEGGLSIPGWRRACLLSTTHTPTD